MSKNPSQKRVKTHKLNKLLSINLVKRQKSMNTTTTTTTEAEKKNHINSKQMIFHDKKKMF